MAQEMNEAIEMILAAPLWGVDNKDYFQMHPFFDDKTDEQVSRMLDGLNVQR